MSDKLVYEAIPRMSQDEIEAVVREDNPDKVLRAVLSAGLFCDDNGPWAEELCHRLTKHDSPVVRGNAYTALGYFARVSGLVDWEKAIRTLNAALVDPDEFARGLAGDGLDDVMHFRKLRSTSR